MTSGWRRTTRYPDARVPTIERETSMTTSAQDDRRAPTKSQIDHPTVAERAAAARPRGPTCPCSAHAEFDPGQKRPDPVALLRARPDARARAGADPLRADAGLALHLLPRRRPDHGRRPGPADARGLRSSSAATPTCPTSASSARPSGAWSSTSTTSTRPCPGPFEWDVKRLAASLAVAGRDGASRRGPRGDRPGLRPRLPDRDGGVRRPEQPADLLRPL